MKNSAHTAMLILLVFAAMAKAEVTISFDGGILYESNGTTPVSPGRLVYAVALPSGQFFPITPLGWVSGDNLLIGNYWLTDFDVLGEDGGFSTVLIFDLAGGVSSGQQFGFVWFPTFENQNTNPAAGSPYGFYTEPGYVIPSDSGVAGFSFETESIGGPIPNSFGTAALQVVPEPSSAALLMLGGAVFVWSRTRGKV